MRLDLYLYENGYAASRQRARVLIDAGQVYIDGVQRTKASFNVPDGDAVTVEIRGEVMPYVGRGGYKMAGMLDGFSVNPAGFVCVDIGASTGGFTDCLLQNGAKLVYAVDSGSDQLAQVLREDDRVVVMEQFNARALDETHTNGRVDLCVCDVSFISLTKILPVLKTLLKQNAQCVCLIKPQFEAGKEKVGKKGVVREASTHLEVVEKIKDFSLSLKFSVLNLEFSPIKGPQGNIEYLIHLINDDLGEFRADITPDTLISQSHIELS